MAVAGSQDDILDRLKRYLPRGWFGADGTYPVVEAALSGIAAAFASIYALYAFAKLQTRIATQTGGWLDLTAADFFDVFPRFSAETDAAYSRRIRLEVFRPRNTRHAIDRAVYDITGQHPAIFEPWRPGDTGGWGTNGFAFGAAGGWGCKTKTFEVWITATLPQNYGIPNRGGWGNATGGYGAIGNFSFVDDADIVGSGATLSQIVSAVDRVRSAGITYWMRFVTPPQQLSTEAGIVLTTEDGQDLVLEG